jgi:AraC family transcriptional regulator
MFRRETILRTPVVSISRTHHPPGTLEPGTEEELETSHSICFVEAGSFGIGSGRRDWVLEEGSVFISRPGAVYRYTHRPDIAPDVCISVAFARGFERDCQVELDFPRIVPRVTNRLAYLKWRLAPLLAGGDGLAVESWSSDLLSALAPAEAPPRVEPLHRRSQLRWYAERVEAVRETLEKQFAEPHSLGALARSVGMSPFQFSRVFRRLTGMPPHQYLLRVRLDAAGRMLRGGASVTDACFDTGFSSLSHFIRLFKRRTGRTPSEFASRRNARVPASG